ncbi:unnamed protein product [Cuscuta europaea]|uniref:Integrase catalytic domain-containing protein n=1 Tax=Cuscuta europaea TaxID=41803 RepID=A0A9P0Z376_CUSEU|nr:unnamed protein product [Cuscuta europaea]
MCDSGVAHVDGKNDISFGLSNEQLLQLAQIMKNQLQDKIHAPTSSDVQINMANTSSRGRTSIIDSGDLSSRKLIGVGRCHNGLYYLESPENKGVAMAVSVNLDLWHQRLGHASDNRLHHIASLQRLERTNNFCDSCVRAKQTRLPFPVSTIKTNRCFELLHCDIWGGYTCESITGARYFLTIVDDFTRGVWVYLMKNKSEVPQILIQFFEMVHTQFEQRAKRIRADNGAEFQTNILINYYRQHGIMLETSCTDTPQQNGVVERKHRHILQGPPFRVRLTY